ncbi:DUF4136 domain-containing protein [Lentiprolixibacter aurantiacus]|uniref:DUF4136 domain-containing protein n=1 Tax=Lentiprolixibacter aurantiacus TaxID=2993939 RepID=A0AAE3MHZ3_9FLAO|nr:DUF4136 domain-containing protein [Lentiprolixibacter aurantiacus]MCX2717995.1 DUF4136 domain-containing protein [Lentiprolixibacter aurantiacus]
MKKFKLLALPVLALLLFASCSTVRVAADYDREADFQMYRSYAFYKTGIDKAQISDLDKKRILKAIDTEMMAKGFVKSQDPDILISIFTSEKERVDVYNNLGWGWGPGWGWGWGPGWGYWSPWMWGGPGWGGNSVSTRTEGSLYIDLIDASTKELVWQGKGEGTLASYKDIAKKEARIREFVSEIMQQYPPGTLANN